MFFGSFVIAAVLWFGVPALLNLIGGLPLGFLNILTKVLFFLTLTTIIYMVWLTFDLVSSFHKPEA